MVFLAAENLNRQIEDLPRAEFSYVNNWQFCIEEITPTVVL